MASAATAPIRQRAFISILPRFVLATLSVQCRSRDQPLLAVIVHGLDQRFESFLHQVTLDLAGGRHRFALFLRVERPRQNTERLDLLDARKLSVGLFDLAADQLYDLGVAHEAGEAGIRHVMAAGPVSD